MLITLQQLKTSLGAVKSYVDKILPKKVSDLDNDTGFITNEEISGKVDIEDLASVATSGDYDDLINKPTIPIVPVTDVQINETSILSNGVADIPIASDINFGVIKVNPIYGIGNYDGFLLLNNATSQDIKKGNNSTKAISTYRQHESTFYGLSKAAGVSMASSDNPVGTYTDEAKTAIRNMIGAVGPTDYATQSTGGVVKIINNGSGGVQIDQGYLMLQPASSNSIKNSNSSTLCAIVPGSQHASTFYGLAKAAGDTTQSQSDNAVGAYTNAAKTAIKNMIGIIDPTVSDVQMNSTSIVSNGTATIPIADDQNKLGVVKVNNSYGITVGYTGQLSIFAALSADIKAGASNVRPITPGRLDEAVFYGLTRAAGVDMSSSSNTVGTYTDAAKTAIKTMLGVPNDTYDLSEGGLLPANASLIDYTTPGIYYADDSTAGTISTCPTDLRFKLIVEKINDRDVRQTVIDYMGRNFTTVINTVTHDVSMWNRVATNDDLSYLVSDVQINGTSIVDEYGWANIPVANNTLGVVKVNTGTNSGIYINPVTGEITTSSASIANIKEGTNLFRPLSPGTQHGAAFYGLAKAAGDTTQAQSDNAIGTYTTNAKTSIQNMLGIPDTFVTRDSVNDAGISARTYTNLFGGEFSVTTATDAEWLNPHARASVTGRISKHYVYRVTVNGTVYNLPCRLWWEEQTSGFKVYEYIGNISLYIGSTSGVPGKKDNVNFLIISDLNNSESIDVLTTTAGSYTILIERVNETLKPLPRSLIYFDEYQPFEVNNNGGTYNGFSLGVNTLNNQRGATAFGYCNTINNEFAIAIGNRNKISGNNGVAIGYAHNISASMGVAFGSSNTVSGSSGVAFGDNTIVNCNNMVAMGRHNVEANTTFPSWENNTYYKKGDIVVANYGPAANLTWICNESHTSIASGQFMNDKNSSDILCWKLAPSNGDTAFAIGNGSTKNDRSNAFKIDFAGNGFFGADVYVNCNNDSTGGQKLATEDYVNSVAVISDVQLNGTSIINNGVANIPFPSWPNPGVVKVSNDYGIGVNSVGTIQTMRASDAYIKDGSNIYRPIVPVNQHTSTFYGLAKAAGDTTQSQSSNAVGNYTDNAKTAIQTMLGILTVSDVNTLIADALSEYGNGDTDSFGGSSL